jgi:PAS domain S-box-containing protein
MVTIELIESLALLVALSLMFTFILRFRNMSRLTGKVLAGLLFGSIAAFGILYSWILETGVIFDGRSVIIPMAGIFGGWAAALLAGSIAAIARIFIGGAGIIPGLLTIFIAVLGGIVFGILRKKCPAINKPVGFLAGGIVIHLFVVAIMVTLPNSSRSNFYQTIMPVYLVIYPLAFTLLAAILNYQEKSNRTLEKLTESEEKHQLLADSAFEAILITDGHRVIDMNQATHQLLGYSIIEINELKLKNCALPEYRQLFREVLIQSPKEPVILKLINKMGDEIIAEIQSKSLHYENKTIQAIAIRNITGQVLAKEELFRSESLFKEAEKVAHLGHWEYDHSTKELYVSDEVYNIYEEEIEKQTVTMNTIFRKIYPDDRRMVFDIYLTTIKTGMYNTFENRLFMNEGRIKHIRQGIYSYQVNGKTVRSFGIIFDITEQKMAREKALETQANLEKMVETRTSDLENSRKAAINLLMDANEQRQRAEIALKQLEESSAQILKLSQAVEQSLAAVAITNTNGEVEYVNQTFVELTGYEKNEIHGKKLNILRSLETTDEFYEDLWKTIKHGKSWKGEFHNKHQSGMLYWESVLISPIFDDKGQIVNFVKVSQDISDRKLLENELIEARDKATLATRAKSEFLANMSHEIRTPMNAILGFADLLSYSLTDSRSIDYVDSLKISGKNLLNLINDILDLSKVEAGMLKITKDFISFRQLMKEIHQIFFFKASEKGLKLHLIADDGFPEFLFTDETRMRQILLNLVSNALKYTDKGEIRLEASAQIPKITHDNPEQSTLDITISVADTGIGMSESFLKVLFDSFTQEEGHDSKRQSGTGLGLAITKNLVTLLGGTITVTSKQGLGSTFAVHFPRVKVSDNQFIRDLQPELTWEDIRFGEATVLLVDDVDDNLKFLSRMLEYAGIKVITSTSGEEALNILQFELPDLIITDIRMPGMDGFELFEIIRNSEATSNIPIVASSASVLHNLNTEEKLARFDGYLLKPIKTTELINSLIKYLPHSLTSGEIAEMNSVIAKTDIQGISIHPAALLVLQQQAMPLYEQLKERQPIKKVEEFGKLLIDTGNKWNNKPLSIYGSEILQTRKSFNIEGMVRLIKQFPELLDQMSNTENAS